MCRLDNALEPTTITSYVFLSGYNCKPQMVPKIITAITYLWDNIGYNCKPILSHKYVIAVMVSGTIYVFGIILKLK